jgi:hypothetical protein
LWLDPELVLALVLVASVSQREVERPEIKRAEARDRQPEFPEVLEHWLEQEAERSPQAAPKPRKMHRPNWGRP